MCKSCMLDGYVWYILHKNICLSRLLCSCASENKTNIDVSRCNHARIRNLIVLQTYCIFVGGEFIDWMMSVCYAMVNF